MKRKCPHAFVLHHLVAFRAWLSFFDKHSQGFCAYDVTYATVEVNNSGDDAQSLDMDENWETFVQQTLTSNATNSCFCCRHAVHFGLAHNPQGDPSVLRTTVAIPVVKFCLYHSSACTQFGLAWGQSWSSRCWNLGLYWNFISSSVQQQKSISKRGSSCGKQRPSLLVAIK